MRLLRQAGGPVVALARARWRASGKGKVQSALWPSMDEDVRKATELAAARFRADPPLEVRKRAPQGVANLFEVGEEPTQVEVSVEVVSDEAIKVLNRRLRGVDKATDVLSAADLVLAGPLGVAQLGDIDVDLGLAQTEAVASVLQHVQAANPLVGMSDEERDALVDEIDRAMTSADWLTEHDKLMGQPDRSGYFHKSPLHMPEMPFGSELPCDDALFLGTVSISADTAQRQAAERGLACADELRILLTHGLLHLYGFDHEQGPEHLEEMAKAEAEVLAACGWRGEGLCTE